MKLRTSVNDAITEVRSTAEKIGESAQTNTIALAIVALVATTALLVATTALVVAKK